MKDYLYDLFIEEAIPALNRHSGGSGGGGGGALNLHFGEEAPTDTSKMWFKCPEPKNVVISSEIGQLPGTFNTSGNVNLSYTSRCVRVGDFAYLFGYGYTTILKYNLRTNELTTLAVTMPNTNMGYAGFAVVDTNIYILGGNRITSIYVFDTVTETFSKLDEVMPTYLTDPVVGQIGTKVYLVGGSANYSTDTIRVFDTETKKVTTLSTKLPRTLHHAASVVYGSKIYMFGGSYYKDSTTKGMYNSIWVYDTDANAVTTLPATLPKNIGYNMALLFGTKAYIFGGSTSADYTSSYAIDTIYTFDVETEELATLDITLPKADYSKVGLIDGTDIYLFYGSQDNAIHKLALQTDVPAGTLHIVPSMDKNMFDIFEGNSEVQLGVSMALLGNAEGHGDPVEAYLYRDGEWGEIQQNGGFVHKCKEPALQEKTVTENGEVVPDAGYDGLSKVVVNVTPKDPGYGTITRRVDVFYGTVGTYTIVE